MAVKVLQNISTFLKHVSPVGNLIISHQRLVVPCHAKMNRHLAMDPTQASLLKEKCIAVDVNDKAIKSISKEEAHLLGPSGELPPLHRAFSVFLFNTKNELLMQQRSKHKITFPGKTTSTPDECLVLKSSL